MADRAREPAAGAAPSPLAGDAEDTYARYDRYYHMVPDGITIQSPRGLVYANDAAAAATGFATGRDLVAAPIAEVWRRYEMLDELGAPLPPDALPGRRALQGLPDPMKLVRYRNRRTGRELWAEVKAVALPPREGEPPLVLNVVHDITDLKGVEAALLATRTDLERQVRLRTAELRDANRHLQVEAEERGHREARHRALLEAIPDLILRLHRDGTVLEVGDMPFEGGASSEELQARGLGILAPQDVGRVREAIGEALDGGTTVSLDIERPAPNGRSFFEVRVVPATAHEVVAIVRDVTAARRQERELERTADELKRSNLALEQFAYAASHDLLEPLRMISGHLGLLERRHGDALPPDARESMDFAVDAARRMDAIVRGLLDYSRVGTQGRDLEATDVDEALDVALANLGGLQRESGARVERGELPTVLADPVQLVQVLQNLVGNAMKFRGDDPPVVRVEAEARGEGWCISVVDNGVGVPAEDRERVFQIFRRLHGRETEGSGIGLALVQRIVERHGGRVWVDPVEPTGSAFRFTLQGADGEPREG